MDSSSAILGLKLLVTPAMIGLASLAGRRWGPALSGWLVGLPFTSGPILLFLALGQGTAFGAVAAAGALAGTASQAAFAVVYVWAASRLGWLASLLAASAAFAAGTALFQVTAPPLVIVAALAVAALPAALWLIRGRAGEGAEAVALPRWDIPARMAVATTLVLILTGVAPMLGPRLTGLLAPYPLYAGVLTVFAHRLQGAPEAAGVLRGLLFGLFAFGAFFWVLALALDRFGIGPAFAAAVAADLVLQAAALLAMRRLWPIRASSLPTTSG